MSYHELYASFSVYNNFLISISDTVCDRARKTGVLNIGHGAMNCPNKFGSMH